MYIKDKQNFLNILSENGYTLEYFKTTRNESRLYCNGSRITSDVQNKILLIISITMKDLHSTILTNWSQVVLELIEHLKPIKKVDPVLDSIHLAYLPNPSKLNDWQCLKKLEDGNFTFYDELSAIVFQSMLDKEDFESKQLDIKRVRSVRDVSLDPFISREVLDTYGMPVIEINEFKQYSWMNEEIREEVKDVDINLLYRFFDHLTMGNEKQKQILLDWCARAVFGWANNAMYLQEERGGIGKGTYGGLMVNLMGQAARTLNHDTLNTFDADLGKYNLVVFDELKDKDCVTKLKQIIANRKYRVRVMWTDQGRDIQTPSIMITTNDIGIGFDDKYTSENRRFIALDITQKRIDESFTKEEANELHLISEGHKLEYLHKFGLDLLERFISKDFLKEDHTVIKTKKYWDIKHHLLKPYQKTLFRYFTSLDLQQIEICPKQNCYAVRLKTIKTKCGQIDESFKKVSLHNISRFLESFIWRGTKLAEKLPDRNEGDRIVESFKVIVHKNFDGYEEQEYNDHSLKWVDGSNFIEEIIIEEEEDLFEDL